MKQFSIAVGFFGEPRVNLRATKWSIKMGVRFLFLIVQYIDRLSKKKPNLGVLTIGETQAV